MLWTSVVVLDTKDVDFLLPCIRKNWVVVVCVFFYLLRFILGCFHFVRFIEGMDLFFISENICDFFPQETPLFLKTKGVIFLSSTVNLFQAHYFSYFS